MGRMVLVPEELLKELLKRKNRASMRNYAMRLGDMMEKRYRHNTLIDDYDNCGGCGLDIGSCGPSSSSSGGCGSSSGCGYVSPSSGGCGSTGSGGC